MFNAIKPLEKFKLSIEGMTLNIYLNVCKVTVLNGGNITAQQEFSRFKDAITKYVHLGKIQQFLTK